MRLIHYIIAILEIAFPIMLISFSISFFIGIIIQHYYHII